MGPLCCSSGWGLSAAPDPSRIHASGTDPSWCHMGTDTYMEGEGGEQGDLAAASKTKPVVAHLDNSCAPRTWPAVGGGGQHRESLPSQA